MSQTSPAEHDRDPTEVIGVVRPGGASGGKGGGEKLWGLSFGFVAWRRAGGRIDERPLSIHQPGLTDEELSALRAAIQPYDILRARIRLTDDEPPRGRLVELLGKEADDELATWAEAYRRPVTVEHPALGTFTLDREFGWYEAEVSWNGQTVRLLLDRGDEDDAELFRAAESLWDEHEEWEKRVRDRAVEELLEGKNDGWLEEGDDELTPAEFNARMTLSSVLLDSTGWFQFSYDDGDLFWGHVIQVSGTLADGPTHTGIAG